VLGEVQYAYNQAKDAKGLPGTVKLGGWYHAGLFDDQRFTAGGLSQADPNSNGVPAQLRSDSGIYGVLEQQVLKIPGKDERGVGVFTRVSTSPDDRNLISFYADGGVNVQGPFAARPKDKLGIGFAYARISNRARDLDRDFEAFAHDGRPVRDAETLLALSYLAEIRQGWVVHPTFQYIIHPGGGYVLDGGVPKAVGNAAVLGVRTVLKFCSGTIGGGWSMARLPARDRPSYALRASVCAEPQGPEGPPLSVARDRGCPRARALDDPLREKPHRGTVLGSNKHDEMGWPWRRPPVR
jgi:porin